jgi:hypothetical protein
MVAILPFIRMTKKGVLILSRMIFTSWDKFGCKVLALALGSRHSKRRSLRQKGLCARRSVLGLSLGGTYPKTPKKARKLVAVVRKRPCRYWVSRA